MNKIGLHQSLGRKRLVMISILVAMLAVFSVIGTLLAQENDVQPTENDGSPPEIGTSLISDTVSATSTITNSVESTGTDSVSTVSPTISVVSDTILMMPFVQVPIPPPALFLVEPTNSSNVWTIGWSPEPISPPYDFEVQESNLPDFSNPTTWILDSSVTTLSPSHPVNWQSSNFYRVRVVRGNHNGLWSNTLLVGSNFSDLLNNSNSGWKMRRQDTDDVNQTTFYEASQFIVRIHGRWDYLLASSMQAGPAPPYRIETRVRLTSQDNLHTYGIVFGGDWNGLNCPSGDYSTCFNHYYRLLVLWSGTDSTLKWQLKRIDYHDQSNQGRGPELIGWKTSTVNRPSETYQIWGIEVEPNGTIKVLVNGKVVGTDVDTSYINDPFFGVIATTNEYSGLRAEYDWYKVTSLRP